MGKKKKLNKSVFDELDGVVAQLRKAYEGPDFQAPPDEQQRPPMRDDDDEDEDNMDDNQDLGQEGSEDDDDDAQYQGQGRRPNPQDQAAQGGTAPLQLSFPTSKKARNALVKALNSLTYSNQSKKDIVGGSEGELQDNFKQEGVNDKSIEGMSNYDSADQGYGGPSPMNPKLMTPKEYEELYNKCIADGNKGPSINVTTVGNAEAYNSKKSFRQDEGLVDVTPFMKSFDSKINTIAGTVHGLTQTIGKIAQAQVASSKAIAAMMGQSQGRQSVGSLNKSQQQQQLPSLNKSHVLSMLEKGCAEGKLSPTELTKFEMTGQMTQPVAAFIQMEGGLK